MYKPVKFIATTKDAENEVNYFYLLDEQKIIPLNNNTKINYKSIGEGIIRIVKSLGALIDSVKIHIKLDDFYYCYLSIIKDDIEYDILTDMKTAINLAAHEKIPVQINDVIINTEGFTVTKELIKDAINEDTYLH